MALSDGKIGAHIVAWEAKLRPTLYSHRRHWPSRLFRHEPLENIVKVLGTGQLLSRNDASAAGEIANDIAPEEIIAANPQAYEHVRLYFRPKTPTQYHIEGIREPCDFFMGKHAPVLYMMVFDAAQAPGQLHVHWSQDGLEFWKKWHFRFQIPDGTYLIEIFVRDCLAYRAYSILQSDPF